MATACPSVGTADLKRSLSQDSPNRFGAQDRLQGGSQCFSVSNLAGNLYISTKRLANLAYFFPESPTKPLPSFAVDANITSYQAESPRTCTYSLKPPIQSVTKATCLLLHHGRRRLVSHYPYSTPSIFSKGKEE